MAIRRTRDVELSVVAEGESLLAPQIIRRLITEFARLPQQAHSPEQLRLLTIRELEVLKLVARGLSNAEIARELYVSETTIRDTS